MPGEISQYLGAAAFVMAGGLAAHTAWASRKASQQNQPPGESGIWAAVAVLFLVLALVEIARPGRWLAPFARQFARDHSLYGAHRQYQVTATAVVALAAVAFLLIGLLSARDYLKRHRLALGCAGVVVAYGIIRFISLDEMDAWSAAKPWTRLVIALVTAAGASVAAGARLRRFDK